jgi:hypothetical protein
LPRNLVEKLVDIEQSYRWLKSGDIKGETESTIEAAKDQVIRKKKKKNTILKEETESACRLCKQHEETIDHLTSGCPILAKNEYLMRHDKVCAHLHYSLCKTLKRQTKSTHTCPSQCIRGRCHNVVESKKEKTFVLIDVAISADRNAVQK